MHCVLVYSHLQHIFSAYYFTLIYFSCIVCAGQWHFCHKSWKFCWQFYICYLSIFYMNSYNHMWKVVGTYQCVFWVGKSTMDQIQSMRQILENTLEYGVSTFHHFIDIKISYDTKNREKLLKDMKEFKIPQKLIGLVRTILEHVKYTVNVQNNLSELFGT